MHLSRAAHRIHFILISLKIKIPFVNLLFFLKNTSLILVFVILESIRSKIFSWYSRDFGSNNNEVLATIRHWLGDGDTSTANGGGKRLQSNQNVETLRLLRQVQGLDTSTTGKPTNNVQIKCVGQNTFCFATHEHKHEHYLSCRELNVGEPNPC